MKPWVVFVIVIGCFAVLYPKIFHPMFRQLFGLSKSNNDGAADRIRDMHPAARARGISPNEARTVVNDKTRTMHMSPAMHAAEMKRQAMQGARQEGGGRSGLIGMVLPIYGVGIVLYLLYMLSKIMGGSGKPEDRAGYEQTRQRELESAYRKIQYNSRSQGFQYGGDEDSDLEGLDDDYKEYIKKKRRQKQFEKLMDKCADTTEDDNMSTIELRQLQERLLETEEQMRRIMESMQKVGKKTADVETLAQAQMKKGKQHLNMENVETVGAGSNNEEEEDHDSQEDEGVMQCEDDNESNAPREHNVESDAEENSDYLVESDNADDHSELAECDQAVVRNESCDHASYDNDTETREEDIEDGAGEFEKPEDEDGHEECEEVEGCGDEEDSMQNRDILSDGVRKRVAGVDE